MAASASSLPASGSGTNNVTALAMASTGTSTAGYEAHAGSVAPKARPGGGLKWSEVCPRVQQPDGSVRTSPSFKSHTAPSAATSPPRPRPGGLGVGKFDPRNGSSRGGSSVGSSGKSSRSLSRESKGRDGDIESRCSSGHGWDTTTNSSGQLSRPRTPENATLSPSRCLDALLMPDPIRTSLVLPPALLEGDAESSKIEPSHSSGSYSQPSGSTADTTQSQQHSTCSESGVGITIKWDPCGRDGPRRKTASEWSADHLAKYLKSVVSQIDANVSNSCVPSSEKLDSFVFRLVANTHRQMRHAPQKVRHALQAMIGKRFQRFWNFQRNEKLSMTTPEELRTTLTAVVEGLVSDFGVSPDLLAQPQPTRSTACIRWFPN